MCSYLTVPAEVTGSAKGPDGWFSVTSASVYYDHPFHAPLEHSLNIDFVNQSRAERSGGDRAESQFCPRTRSMHPGGTRCGRGGCELLRPRTHPRWY